MESHKTWNRAHYFFHHWSWTPRYSHNLKKIRRKKCIKIIKQYESIYNNVNCHILISGTKCCMDNCGGQKLILQTYIRNVSRFTFLALKKTYRPNQNFICILICNGKSTNNKSICLKYSHTLNAIVSVKRNTKYS